MLLIGITGGIGMGKSTVADYLAARGEWVIDTDVLARKMVEPGEPAFHEIQNAFGAGVISDDGTLNRSALAALVFQNEQKRKLLEEILHPRIRNAWKQWVSERSREGVSRAIVVIPLLFETGAEKELDLTICVACSISTQYSRLQKRGWGDVEITKRIAAQLPIREKMDNASRVVWNEASLDICELQVSRVFEAIKG